MVLVKPATVIQCFPRPNWRKAGERAFRSPHAAFQVGVIALPDGIMARGAPIHANRVKALVSKMFNFAIAQDLVEVACSPQATEFRMTALIRAGRWGSVAIIESDRSAFVHNPHHGLPGGSQLGCKVNAGYGRLRPWDLPTSRSFSARMISNEFAASLWMELPTPPILASPRDHHPMDCGGSFAGGFDLVLAGLRGSRIVGVLRVFAYGNIACRPSTPRRLSQPSTPRRYSDRFPKEML